MWIPINKKTGEKYPAITAEEKKEMEAYPVLSVNGIHKYRYEQVSAPLKPKEPKEAKKVTNKK